MNKADIETMELGNLLFGNSRGVFHIEPREEYQDAFAEFLFANGFDGYGFKDGDREFENDKFIIRTYYWGEDEKIAALPNFVYKPSGLEISWYKYPMRDAYSNQDIDIESFRKVLQDCADSLTVNDDDK